MGIFTIATVFDLLAAVLAWFVLRRMKRPSHVPQLSDAAGPEMAVAAGLDRQNFFAAFLALLVLRPRRQRTTAQGPFHAAIGVTRV